MTFILYCFNSKLIINIYLFLIFSLFIFCVAGKKNGIEVSKVHNKLTMTSTSQAVYCLSLQISK